MAAGVLSSRAAKRSNAQQQFVLGGTTGVTIDAIAGKRIVITDVYASGTVTAFTINCGANTWDPGPDSLDLTGFCSFPEGTIVGDVNTNVVVTTTGASKTLVCGYIVNEISS